MILFFQKEDTFFAVQTETQAQENLAKLEWLFGNAQQVLKENIAGDFIGPRREII